MTTGLVLGKFAPLHHGHQRLIETSLRETDHTIVLIYDCPDLDTPPLPVRARWLQLLYPQVEVIEAWDGPIETGLSPEITQKHDAYLLRRVGHRGITHFFSSEAYGEHVSQALKCVDCRVDQARAAIPISATQIRSAPFKYRHFLASCVYWDLVIKIVFLGAPSTGKTTLASTLARDFQTEWMPEYGRQYWEQHQKERRLTREQLLQIAVEHRRREETLVHNANHFYFIDTDASSTLQFSYYYHGDAVPQLKELAAATRERYDLFFLCAPDIPYDNTWDRSGEANREQMHRRIISDLITRKVPFHMLTGPLAERCERVQQILRSVSPQAFI
jgi:NadR type nicotinamide-nucleotide adenylyltransferase